MWLPALESKRLSLETLTWARYNISLCFLNPSKFFFNKKKKEGEREKKAQYFFFHFSWVLFVQSRIHEQSWWPSFRAPDSPLSLCRPSWASCGRSESCMCLIRCNFWRWRRNDYIIRAPKKRRILISATHQALPSSVLHAITQMKTFHLKVRHPSLSMISLKEIIKHLCSTLCQESALQLFLLLTETLWGRSFPTSSNRIREKRLNYSGSQKEETTGSEWDLWVPKSAVLFNPLTH